MKVVFILSANHSGSTLLDLLLDGHSRIIGAGEMHGASADEQCACGRVGRYCPVWSAALGTPPWKDRRIYREKLDFLLGRGSYRYVKGHASVDEEEYADAAVSAYAALLATSGAGVVVDSSKSVERAELLARDPRIDPVVIQLVRDGRAVAWSYMRKYHRYLAYAFSWPLENLKISIFRRRYRGAWLFMRYEDLVADPARELTRVCDALGLTYESAMTDIGAGEHHEIEGNRIRLTAGRQTIRADEAWRREMPRTVRLALAVLYAPMHALYRSHAPHAPAILYLANIRLPTEKAHGTAIMRMCAALRRAQLPVRLVVARRFTTLSGDPHDVYGVVEHIPITRLPVIDLFPWQGVSRLLAHTVETSTYLVSLTAWLLWRSRRRNVLYTRDMLSLVFALAGFAVVYECHVMSRWRRLQSFLAQRAAAVVVISEGLRDSFIAAGIEPSRIIIEPSGVDVEIFASMVERTEARRALGLAQGAFFAVYAGTYTTMGRDKGIADTLRALTHLPGVRFLAVGGAEGDISRYTVQARELGVLDSVTFIGYVPQKTLALYQRAADVLLMPFPDIPHYRRYMSPMKLFEYMASGRPIIASDLPTIRGALSGELATFVPPGDPTALAEALRAVATRPAEAERKAEQAAMEAKRYSWDERTRRILSFLGERGIVQAPR